MMAQAPLSYFMSVARRNSLKPPARTFSRIASSDATAPSAGPSSASEFEVQHRVEAAAKVRPIGLKFSSTVFPAIGSTIKALPSWASAAAARLAPPPLAHVGLTLCDYQNPRSAI